MARNAVAALLATALLSLPVVAARASDAVAESKVDALFAAWSEATPGCAVGVSQGGQIVLERAYGMADLEHGVANRPDTIFEAGSVSKQFTAAAVLLLAEDGKLSLDDPVRKYIPELPEYAAAITIRQMLHHTSGLRDWGNVAGIGGWPRGTRIYTHDHVLDILARQEALNFMPGTRWSYSNSGYNLAAILVSRVAGESFADFTRKRIFEPLGMTRTSWRDDFTRIVPDRAIAYARVGDRYALDMPFENIHGNGGLLTTVGDLLRWNQNFTTRKVGGPEFVATMQASGRLASGEPTHYGFGLGEARYQGLQEFRHSGSTGSYRTFLSRFPEPAVSVAVLCNAGDSTPGQTLHAVADLYLAGVLRPEPPPKPARLSAAHLDALAGMYRNIDRGNAIAIVHDGDGLRLEDGTPLIALSPLKLTDGDGSFMTFDGSGGAVLQDGSWPPELFERVPAARPASADLEMLAGRYQSDEAETEFIARVQGGVLQLVQRPATVYALKPLYADAFEGDLGTIIFRRDDKGTVNGLSVSQDRVWDLHFPRITPAAPGELLSSERLQGVLLPPGLKGWRIQYRTSIDDETPAVAAAIVLAPETMPAGPRPVITWTHGTTGLLQDCMPSVMPAPSEGIPAREEIIANGWVVVATDYGFAERGGPHPYLIGEGEARSALDAVRAARRMPELQLDERTVVWGHSQGGHAALWTGIAGTRYAPEIRIVGVAAVAPAADVRKILELNPMADKLLGPYVAGAYARFYPDLSFESLVRPEALESAREIAGLCAFYPPENAKRIAQVAASFTGRTLTADSNAAFARRLTANAAHAPIAAPVVVAQGLRDVVVPPPATAAFVAARCADGQHVEFWTFADLDHAGIVQPGSALDEPLAAWTQARFAGEPAASACTRTEH